MIHFDHMKSLDKTVYRAGNLIDGRLQLLIQWNISACCLHSPPLHICSPLDASLVQWYCNCDSPLMYHNGTGAIKASCQSDYFKFCLCGVLLGTSVVQIHKMRKLVLSKKYFQNIFGRACVSGLMHLNAYEWKSMEREVKCDRDLRWHHVFASLPKVIAYSRFCTRRIEEPMLKVEPVHFPSNHWCFLLTDVSNGKKSRM